ncbi:MAG: helix-turn-helix domain-containing protein [Spirochaetaceae bacterium]|nr:helix-turn-helix domain-containing protein [Spirochaetaceae bacterium]
MESFGKLLKDARESKNIDIETAVIETSISRNHLEALENEQIEKFPGETYLIGFLKNYSNYLGLDTSQILALYRGKKIQEAPPPRALLQRQPPVFLKPLIIFFVLIGITGICLAIWFIFISPKLAKDDSQTVLDSVLKVKTHQLSNQPLSTRVYEGDIISVPSEGGNIDLIVSSTLENLQLITPAGTQLLELSEERELDIDGQTGSEIIVYLSDISNTDASRGAEVRIMTKNPALAQVEETNMEIIPDSSSAGKQQLVILQDNRAYPFTLNISFRSPCILRYRSDNNEAIEDYFLSGDLLTVQSSNGTRLWVSNINAIKIQVIAAGHTYDLEVGKAGKVVAQDIKWVRDTNGVYKLAVINVD